MPAPHTRPAAGTATRKPTLRQPTRRIAASATDRSNSPAVALKPTSTNIMRLQRSPSVQSIAGAKRKEREYEPTGGEDTSIHVVVRCRGRNDREIQENSAVVVSTEGTNGVELSMGPNALSNKAYHFDKVFSPAADQTTLFDDVVTPILNEVCLIQLVVCDDTNLPSQRCYPDIIVQSLPTVRRVREKHTQCREI